MINEMTTVPELEKILAENGVHHTSQAIIGGNYSICFYDENSQLMGVGENKRLHLAYAGALEGTKKRELTHKIRTGTR